MSEHPTSTLDEQPTGIPAPRLSPNLNVPAPLPHEPTTQEMRVESITNGKWHHALDLKVWGALGAALATLIGTCSNGSTLEERHKELAAQVQSYKSTNDAQVEIIRAEVVGVKHDLQTVKAEQKADFHALYRAVLERRPQERFETDGGAER